MARGVHFCSGGTFGRHFMQVKVFIISANSFAKTAAFFISVRNLCINILSPAEFIESKGLDSKH